MMRMSPFEDTYHIWIQILSSFFKLHRIGLGIGENFIGDLGDKEVQTYGQFIGLREEGDASQFNYASIRWFVIFIFPTRPSLTAQHTVPAGTYRLSSTPFHLPSVW